MSETTLERTNEQNRLELARTALENGNSEEAIKYSNEVLEMNSENAEAWMIKGEASANVATGIDVPLRYKEAMSCLDRAKKIDPTLKEIEVKREEVKERFCNFLCSLGKQVWDGVVNIANVGGYGAASDLISKALGYYERALAINPMYGVALRSVIHIRKETGRLELAATHIERIQKIDPSYKAPKKRWWQL